MSEQTIAMQVIVAFVSQKGGVGKSTLTRALATSARAAGIPVTVADLDFQQQTTKRWAERRADNEVGIGVALESFASVAEAVDTIPDGDRLLIVDAPPRASRGTLEIAYRADLIVQPSGPGIDDLDPAILLFHELSRAGISNDKLVVALTRVASKNEENLARRYVEKAGYSVLAGSVYERTAYREAHNRGQSIAEVADLDEHSRTLMHGLLGLITDCVKRRVKAARPKKKKAGQSA